MFCIVLFSSGVSPSGNSANITSSETVPGGTLITTSGSSVSGGNSGKKNGNNNNNNNSSSAPNNNSSRDCSSESAKGSMEHLASETKDGWPALNTVSAKENNSSKRNRSKSERGSGSARQTPTEEHNKRYVIGSLFKTWLLLYEEEDLARHLAHKIHKG